MLVLLLGFGRPLPAVAHASLIAAEPPPGARLEQAPSVIHLTFNEPLAPGSSLALHTPDFRAVAGITTAVNPQAPEQLQATLPLLEAGVYTVQWEAVSPDGHTITGSYQFTVVPPAAAVAPSTLWPWLGLAAVISLSVLLVARRRR
jgi:methionine-rich copper-binding protein CopC